MEIELEKNAKTEKQEPSDVESESLGDEIEFIDKPERKDIEKKLE